MLRQFRANVFAWKPVVFWPVSRKIDNLGGSRCGAPADKIGDFMRNRGKKCGFCVIKVGFNHKGVCPLKIPFLTDLIFWVRSCMYVLDSIIYFTNKKWYVWFFGLWWFALGRYRSCHCALSKTNYAKPHELKRFAVMLNATNQGWVIIN
jgi:hypothetical protein